MLRYGVNGFLELLPEAALAIQHLYCQTAVLQPSCSREDGRRTSSVTAQMALQALREMDTDARQCG